MEKETIDIPIHMPMEYLKGKPVIIPNLGSVTLIDWMGDDGAIVDAARLCYGAKRKRQDDRSLIRFLMRHRHTTPFEQCTIKFLIDLPMDLMRQLVRHRTARLNEYSTRYTTAIDEFATTDPKEWRLQNPDNKQGSSGFVHEAIGLRLSTTEAEFHRMAREVYQSRIAAGVAREQARKDLPLSNMTRIVWQMDLHNLMHFLALRLDSHAQAEIRAYANVIADVVAVWCPLAWEAFKDYRLNAVTFSEMEMTAIGSALTVLDKTNQLGKLAALNLNNSGAGDREIAEFETKLGKLR